MSRSRGSASATAALAAVLAAGCAGEKGCAELRVNTLASSQHEYGAIAVDGAFVYWLDRGTPDDDYAAGGVFKVPRGGGDAVLLAADRGNLLGIAVDEANVYWTHPGGPEVMKVPKGGGAAAVIARAERSAGSVAVDRSSLYFTEQGWNGAVRKVSKAGGPAVTLASDQRHPDDLVASGEVLYWTTSAADEEGAILSVKLGGGAPSTLVDKQRRPRCLAVDEAYVYWIGSRASEGAPESDLVLRVAKTGGEPQVIADGQGFVALAVDERNVYWAAARSGQVLGAPKAGGSWVAIAERQNGPGAVAADASGIYWATDAMATRGVKGQRHEAAVRVAEKH